MNDVILLQNDDDDNDDKNNKIEYFSFNVFLVEILKTLCNIGFQVFLQP